jgi:hypothetical protein
MKQSQVKPGVRAMLSLGHRGAVAVTVRYERTGLARLNGKTTYVCVDSSGTERTVSARQLQPMPAPAAHSWPSPSEAFENWRNQYVGR